MNKNRCDGYLTVMVGCARTRGERNNRGGQNASIAYGKPNSDTNLLVRQPTGNSKTSSHLVGSK